VGLLIRGRLKNNFELVLVLFMAITDKAWDALQRTVSEQFHRSRMGVNRADGTRSQEVGAATALHATKRGRRNSLYCAGRVWLADAAARSAAVEVVLLLFHDLAQSWALAEDARPTARCGAAPERKKKAPTAAILDSQSVKVSNHGGVRGYDAGKKIMGRKRHILVDTLGLILAVVVHPANIQDRDGARLVLKKLAHAFGWLRLIWVDGGYAGEPLGRWLKALLPRRGLRLEVVKRHALHTFKILPKRWIVERTFGWLSKYRRFAKDYEYHPANSEALILIAASHLMVRRLA